MRSTYRLLSLPFFVMLMLAFIPQCIAEDDPDIDISAFPQQISDALNIPVLASELFLTTMVLLSIAMTLSLLKAKGLLILIVEMPALTFLIALTWCPVWVLLLLSLVVALFYGSKIQRQM